ncbi:PREDICTED: zinc finger protein ZFPM1 [Chinchilla lanigera]|uniref:zinc finger protein ZFPM1 n=1 Tax=Chinchilla lanigera TaxID=34839 RepID=UPI0006984E73|nr:PREDICTED: zinc finger protein ZFPM1 [Chinchilla lanigera]
MDTWAREQVGFRDAAAHVLLAGSPGDMDAVEEAQAPDTSLEEQETPAPEPMAVGRPEPLSPSSTDVNPPPAPTAPAPVHPTSPGAPEEMEGPEPETQPLEESASPWSGPEELELELRDGQRCVQARLSLHEGLSWGPFHGSIQTTASSPGQAEPGPALTLLLTDEACWLRTLPQALTEADANSEIYRKDDSLWCRITRPVPAGEALCVLLTAKPQDAPSCPVKEEPAEPKSPALMHPDIQLLPQQAGMASILATAVINKDVFPCKDCGIWYRSERNLQAHLLYYCASRQGASSPATAATEDKPKEPYPNERICPFPQCRKSCPSASSLEIHMRSHSGERPFVCLICLSAFTTKANCERHLKVHTDTLSGVCHSCGFISTTRDILYSHLVTSHMVCQPGSKGEIYSPGTAHPAAKLPADVLASLQQHAALHGPLPSADLGPATTPSPAPDRKVLAEATNGEARAGPQNGSSAEPPAAPRSVKVEAEEESEAARAPGQAEPATRGPSRTPSPHSPGTTRVKAELPSPTPGASPAPGELALASTLFLPQLVFAPDAGATPGPAAPQASEILAKMSELVHSRLQQGAGPPAALLGTKGATCFECEITFNNVNNFYVHKRLYCSGRRAPEDAPATRRPKAPPGAPAEPDAPRSPPGPGAREEDAGGAATPEAEGPGRGSEDSQSPGSSVDDAEDDPSRTLCEACNIRFSRHETYTVHKRYYCASRHDPPPRKPPAPAPGSAAPALTTPPVRTRRRRKLYELHAPACAPAPPGHAPPPAGHAPAAEPPVSPRLGSGSGGAGPAPARSPARSPAPTAADGPIDLSKRPRRQTPDAPAALPALADYHECTACRVSFHSLEAYLAHKQYACPAAPLRPAAVCPYCPANGRARGDLVEHLRRAHGLRVPAPGAPAERAPRDSPPPRSPSPAPAPAEAPADPGATTPGKGPPAAPAAGGHRYCRLCNIRFSSLSTFIAHKKYYCSSHAAEHVK